MNSGDATSQGWSWAPNYCTPPPDFLSSLGWSCSDVPLFKSQTEVPNAETPAFLGWVPPPGSDATFGAWQRTLPQSPDNLVEFSGRFVYEQAAPGGYDGCYQTAIDDEIEPPGAISPFTSVTGGGWYVNGSGIWGSGWAPIGGTNLLNSDYIGIPSNWVQWYQMNVGTCSITLQQRMFIDSVNSPIPYNSGGPNQATNQLEIDINAIPPEDECVNDNNVATVVTPNGGNPAPACEDYP